MSYKFFDKQFLVMPDDKDAIGKKVFYNDNLHGLIKDVENGNFNNVGVLDSIDDADCDCCFVVADVGWNLAYWQFVYYDPNYDVKVAYYKKGKQIQFKSHIVDNWSDCCVEPCWDDNCDYRIKPDEPEKNVVPATKFPSLCGYCIHRKDGCTPKSADSCVNFFSTNDDYFRVKKNYVDLVKEHVELERKYGALVSGIQQLMHGPVNMYIAAGGK